MGLSTKFHASLSKAAEWVSNTEVENRLNAVLEQLVLTKAGMQTNASYYCQQFFLIENEWLLFW